jgi:prolipoprotein diacylglyceryltransferase
MLLLRCYPKVTDFIYELFNHAPWADYRFLPVFSYGFWVAVGFVAAATLATIEMRRREKLGLLKGQDGELTVGEAPRNAELVFYAVFGFLLFFKLVGMVVYQPLLSTYQLSLRDFMFSLTYGNWVAGIIGGAGMAYYYYWSKKKQQLPKPEVKKIKIYPSDNIGDLVVIAAILGVLGSVLFNFLESSEGYDRFWQDPVGFLTSGLSVYGGLICAGAGFWVYAWKKNIHIGHFFDSIAPAFMLANGIGRLGCQTSGDGDWGVVNLTPAPAWLPDWFWSSRYEHNIINEGVLIPGCIEEHCFQLAEPVFPTPIYEFLMCSAVFLILWSLRKKLTNAPGIIFSLFMVLIGIQRFTIEQWRAISDRELYHLFGVQLKQSELISIILFCIGTAITAYLWRHYKKLKTI